MFRRVTVPLLAPVLVVVLVTLMINVLKVFDLVFVIAPQSVQDDANVIALQMYRVSFGGGSDQGLGSALGVFLLILVLPVMIFNIRRLGGTANDDRTERRPVGGPARRTRRARQDAPGRPVAGRLGGGRC